MGKVFQPEVAARGIVFAAAHNRREIYIGMPTYTAIIGDKIASWYADRVLAKSGIQGQQTDEPKSPDRQNNVWEPVPGDMGTYGDFGDIAKDRSFTLWASMNRSYLLAAFIAVILLLLFALIF